MRLHSGRRLIVWLCAGVLSSVTSTLAQPRPDRSTPPRPGTPPALTLPTIQKRTLTNGIGVWVVEQHEVPLAHVRLVLRGGAATDPTAKAGVANLMASLLTEGAGSRDALAFADAVDVLGATLSARTSWDAISVALHVPVARLDAALPLMRDAALRPTFDSADVERVRKDLLTTFLSQKDMPPVIADRAFARTLFGPSHRYGAGIAGTTRTAQDITVDDIRSAHARLVHPSHALLVVVGDVTTERVLPLLEDAFGRWTGTPGVTAPAPLPQAQASPLREIVLVDKPGAPQSQIRIGAIGVPRTTPARVPLTVMNTILGGSFTSRLNTNLREVHGYSYGAGSRFDMRRSQGVFVAQAGVQTDKTSESVQEFFNEFAAMLKATPEADVAKAKNLVALGYPEEFETIRDVAAKLEELFVFGLPEQEPSLFVPAVNALTAKDLDTAAHSAVTPERFQIVVVGDRAVIEPGLKALKLGKIRIMTIDEAMGEKP